MTTGESVGGSLPTPYDAPPSDTGEALGLNAAGLTLTFGFGPDASSRRTARTGSASRTGSPPCSASCRTSRPTTSTPSRSNGDLCVQACAHDPQVAVHAIRNLARIGFGTVALRWAQLGFGRTSSTSTAAGDAAQPARLQGRHRQPQGRGHRRTSTSSSGSREGDDAARRLAGRRLLPRRPPDQHAHRAVGPHQPARAGDADRPQPRGGRPALRRHRVHRARLRRAGPRGSAHRGRRARAAGPPDAQQGRPSCCAAATTSPTAATRSAASTPGCSSSPSCATPTSTTSRCRPSCPARTR